MGDVISIKRSSDIDLFEFFEKACPQVPVDVDEVISQSASRALGGELSGSYKPSFRNICLAVASVCCIGMLLAHGLTTRWNNAVVAAAESASYTSNQAMVAGTLEDSARRIVRDPVQMAAAIPHAQTSAGSWHRSRAAWAEYIARLESDPFYQYVESEKARFASQYPDL